MVTDFFKWVFAIAFVFLFGLALLAIFKFLGIDAGTVTQ